MKPFDQLLDKLNLTFAQKEMIKRGVKEYIVGEKVSYRIFASGLKIDDETSKLVESAVNSVINRQLEALDIKEDE